MQAMHCFETLFPDVERVEGSSGWDETMKSGSYTLVINRSRRNHPKYSLYFENLLVIATNWVIIVVMVLHKVVDGIPYNVARLTRILSYNPDGVRTKYIRNILDVSNDDVEILGYSQILAVVLFLLGY